ncbi:hypothetical protein [Aestuariivirga litoralis]|uniref:hypothetical protein n=1 Tax=Aestuariivirga litoralis TaxID=2650924 RepID=UPI0018C67456|nr:hypothetical protein [Aestuariivirga litoralis]MBG1233729.1 hypothetical protein [Aestuariivirga litoralis]
MPKNNESSAQQSRRLLGPYWPWPGSDRDPALIGTRMAWMFGGMLVLSLLIDSSPSDVMSPTKRLVESLGIVMLIGWFLFKRHTEKKQEAAWRKFAEADPEGYKKAMDEAFGRA